MIKTLFLIFVLFTLTHAEFDGLKFPKDFTFGTATAAYQIEGGHNLGGRAPSIWDTFSQTPGKVYRNHNGNVACDHFHKWKSDIQLMKNLGVQHYRLSISWSRVMPTGKLPVNPAGIRFYSNLIDELIKNGIEPHVTLYHWDLPQGLEDAYKGWLSREIVFDFRTYADVLFKNFGDRVKNWITINEPYIVTNLGYNAGIFAPGRCSDRTRCPEGNSRTEPWVVTHHMLLAHAQAWRLYDRVYRRQQGGKIGITLNGDHAEPFDINNPLDHAACERQQQFNFGWFADPIYFGDYPDLLKKAYADVLPRFTEQESQLLKGTNDFFGLNTYTSIYVKHVQGAGPLNFQLGAFNASGSRVGKIYTPSWLSHVPWGIRPLIVWLGTRYNNPNIVVTENGCGDRTVNDDNHPPSQYEKHNVELKDSQFSLERSFKRELNDTHRVEFYKGYLRSISKAIYEDGIKVSGYFAWSFMDNFEWADGYSIRFGLHWVDYQSKDMKRYQKDSAKWWSRFLAWRRK